MKVNNDCLCKAGLQGLKAVPSCTACIGICGVTWAAGPEAFGICVMAAGKVCQPCLFDSCKAGGQLAGCFTIVPACYKLVNGDVEKKLLYSNYDSLGKFHCIYEGGISKNWEPRVRCPASISVNEKVKKYVPCPAGVQ